MKRFLCLLLTAVFLLCFVGCGSDTPDVENLDAPENTELPKDLPRMVMVKGLLYEDTGSVSTVARCGVMDGEITSSVNADEIPTKDDQSNFGAGCGYQFAGGDEIHIYMDDQWQIFALAIDEGPTLMID